MNIASRQQNQTLLASSLQIAFNLRVLPSLVQNLVSDLSHTVDDRIRGAFDLSKISKDVVSKGDPLSDVIFIITSDDESPFRLGKQSSIPTNLSITSQNRANKRNCTSMDCSTLASTRGYVPSNGRLLHKSKTSLLVCLDLQFFRHAR